MLNSVIPIAAATIPPLRPESGGLGLFDSWWTVLNILLFVGMAVAASVIIIGVIMWIAGSVSNNPSMGTRGMKGVGIGLAGFIVLGSINAIIIFGMGLGLGA